MTVRRHVSHERTAADRGRGLGRELRDAIAVTVAVYDRMFALDMGLTRPEVLDLGRRVGDALGDLRPAAREEICGIAQGSGHPDELLLAVNARTEILAGGSVAGVPRPPRAPAECSVIGAARSGQDGAVLAQTWDFHPDLAAARLLWIATPPGERGWATLTEAGILAKTGVNADGLAVTVNFLASLNDGGLGGVPVHVLVRWLLEECADLDAAERVLRSAPRNASICMTVAARAPSARGRIVAFELVPDGCEALVPDDRGHVAHTNHFLTQASGVASAAGAALVENSVRRLDQLQRVLDREGADLRLDAIAGALSDARDASDPVFRRVNDEAPWLERCMTLATVAYEAERGSMWLRAEPDPSAPLERAALPWEA